MLLLSLFSDMLKLSLGVEVGRGILVRIAVSRVSLGLLLRRLRGDLETLRGSDLLYPAKVEPNKRN